MIAFSRAITGLRIAEQNLYVTSNNLSNVETEGYHRQRLNQYDFGTTKIGNLNIGLGVDADSIRQARLDFLENNYRNELASYGRNKYEDKVYTSLQSIIGDDGSYLQDSMHDLWEAFNELAKEYTTTIAGGYLRENAVSLIAEFDGINDQLNKMQNELNTEVINTVRKINDYASQIAALNDKITRSEADGSTACELRDSRDSVIASLSELVDVVVENSTNTTVDIRTPSGYLVVRTHSNRLTTDTITPGSIFCSPIWEGSGQEFVVTDGELKGILEMRGGDVIGNLEHSSNGAPKEKMDIVVSIDADMDEKTTLNMVNNLFNLFDTLDRQDVNYKLYLTNGEEIAVDDLMKFKDYLMAEIVKKEVTNSPATKMTELIDEMSEKYGKDSEVVECLWEYIDNTLDFDSFADELYNNTDDQELQDVFYNRTCEDSVSAFCKYAFAMKDLDVTNIYNFLNGETPFSANTAFDKDNINAFLDTKFDTSNVPADIVAANKENPLWNVSHIQTIDFRDDSNPYLLVLTDEGIRSDIDDVAAILNAADMHVIAITDDDSEDDWKKLVEETDGSVLNLSGFETAETADQLGLAVSRAFNSRLMGVQQENGIAFFRSGLNSIINALTREINGIMRQGINAKGIRHGDTYIDPETGEEKEYNLDLFVKIDNKLPLQMGNIQINPLYEDVLNMPLSLSGDTGDFRIGNMLVDLTATDVFSNNKGYATFDEHYADFILNFGQAANKALTGYEIQETVLNTAKDRILQVSGVSMDEELSNMVKFQYSYTASSKMIRVIDEMLQTILRM
jgi:flagellar hook-associated protein FlgK